MKKTKLRWGVVALIFVVTAINYMDRAVLGVAAPHMMKDLDISAVGFGLLASAFFWTYTLMQIPVGAIVDKFGAKMTYSIAIIWWSICTVLTATGRSIGVLIGIRALMGIGESPAFPTNTRVIKDWLPSKERGVANGLFMMGIAVGAGLTTPVLAWVIESFGWQAAFIVTGACGLLWLPFWFIYFKNNPADSKMNQEELKYIQEDHTQESVEHDSKVKWYHLLKEGKIWSCMFGLFSQNYLNYMVLTWLPTYLVMERGMTLLKAGFNAVIPWIAASIGAIVGGLLSDWLIKQGWRPIAARRVVMAGGLVICLAIIPAAFVSSDALAITFISLALGGMMFAGSGVWSILTDIAPSGSLGTVAGLQNFFGNLAGWIAPISTGVIVAATGSFVWALVVAGVLVGVASIGYFIFLKENKTLKIQNIDNGLKGGVQ